MGKGKIKAPLPVIILIAAFLCPTELSLYIAGLRFPPHRVALFALFPIAIMRLLSQQGLKLRLFDVFFVAFNVWTVVVYMHHMGQQEGLVYGGSQALEGLGAYLVARVWIRNQDQFRAALRVLAIAILIAAAFALPETLLGQIFTHNILHSLTGYYHPIGIEQRMGLTRAYGVFDHPIHYGTFCAAMLAMFWYSEKTTGGKLKRTAMVGGATLLGLSSAPLLCVGLQLGMIFWDRITQKLRGRAWLTWTVIVGLFIGISMFSNRGPVALIATGLTIDPWTGFYRLMTWEYGLDNVWAYPVFGLGLGDWERPAWMFSNTIDAFWLVIMIRTGVPSFLLLVIGIALIARAVVKRGMKNSDISVKRLARGWMFSLVALCLMATTVHLWNVPYSFFFFFLGISGWFADPPRVVATIKKPLAANAKQPAAVQNIAPVPARPAPPIMAVPVGAGLPAGYRY